MEIRTIYNGFLTNKNHFLELELWFLLFFGNLSHSLRAMVLIK